MGMVLNSIFKQMMRDARHLKDQTAGRQMIAQRLGIPGPWQPEMVNYPSFVCAHCQFPHVLRQTLLGCSACAAPYFTSEAIYLSKNGILKCLACEAEQNISAMPLCCTNCRCIQGVPARLDWRRTFARFPAWRSYIGSLISILLGLLLFLGCALGGQSGSRNHADDMVLLGIFLGCIPAVFGVIVLIAMLLRKKMPSELMLSCGGFGVLTPEGEERWFSWHDIHGLQAQQPSLNSYSPQVQPDSMATGWFVHTAQDRIFFDGRLQKAREFAREIRMRAPAAPLVDLPPMERASPWAILVFLFIMLVIIGVSVAVSLH